MHYPVIRGLVPGAARQWVSQGSNELNPQDDHLFEARVSIGATASYNGTKRPADQYCVQYCGKLFAICVTQMRIMFPAFEPLLSDAVYVAEEICNDQTNLISIPLDFHRVKTGYLNENSQSGEVFLEPCKLIVTLINPSVQL